MLHSVRTLLSLIGIVSSLMLILAGCNHEEIGDSEPASAETVKVVYRVDYPSNISVEISFGAEGQLLDHQSESPGGVFERTVTHDTSESVELNAETSADNFNGDDKIVCTITVNGGEWVSDTASATLEDKVCSVISIL